MVAVGNTRLLYGNDMEWEKYFDENILKRGEEYYRNGKVTDFQADGRKRTATVIGTEEYSVSVEFDRDGSIVDMQCSCPYAENGEYCKHMAAVLYREYCGDVPAIYSKIQSVKKPKGSQKSKTEKNIDTLPVLPADVASLKDEIKKIIAHYKRQGYIEYRYAYECAMQVSETMETNAGIYLRDGRYKEAFDYSFFALRKFCATDMDDSDGGTGMVCEVGLEIWKQTLQDAESEQYVFKQLLKYKASDQEWYLKEQAEHFLFTNFDKSEYYERKMQYIEDRIAEVCNETDLIDYKLGYYLKQKIDLMRKSNVSEQTFEQFRQKYWSYAEVQADCIEEKIQKQQYKEAESLLLECLAMPFGKGVSTEYCREQLMIVYEKTGDKEGYRKTLSLEYNSSIEKYEELKRLYNAEEWLTVRETVLQNIWKNNRELLPEILLREGMKDRLLKLAVSYPGLYYIQKYEKDLKQEYAEEILGKYKVEFQKLTESASTRATYREIAKQLRKLSRYDEGKELVRELVAEWKEKYPKRKAMMEELDKVIVTNPKERG